MAKSKRPSTSANNKAATSAKDVKLPEGAKGASVTGTPKVAAAADAAKASASKAVETAKEIKTSGADKSAAPVQKVADKVASADVVKKPEPAKSTAQPAKSVTSKPAPVAAVSQPAPAERPSVFLPVLLGVATAGVLGFLASEYNLFGLRNDGADLSAQLASQQEQIAALTAAQAELNVPDISGLTDEVGTLKTNVETAIGETLPAIEGRLSDVEKRPLTGDTDAGKAAFAAYEKQFNDLKSSIETQGAEVAEQKSTIQGLLDNALSAEQVATEAARSANIQAALTKITAAMNAGEPYAPALAELEAAGETDIPAELSGPADTGVSTLATLQGDFPDVARAALKVARVEAPSEEESGVGGFLKRQLGARSVVPREGSSPDAVLSRAEAAVRSGALPDAFTEIEALPEQAQGVMQEWLSAARTRQAAQAAADDLFQRLTAK